MIEDHSSTVTVSPPVEPVATPAEKITARQRALLLSIREALRLMLSAIEDYMGMDRTVEKRRK
jgi:hypothetical protein